MSRLEDLLSCPISLVSVGPDRRQIILVKDFFTR
jgi:adenylosuccinate synthase